MGESYRIDMLYLFMSLLCFSLSFASLYSSRKHLGDYLSPGSIVLSVWSICLGLYFSHIVDYPSLSFLSYVIILNIILSFGLLSFLLIALAAKRNALYSIGKLSSATIEEYKVYFSDRRMLGMIIFLFIIATISTVIQMEVFGTKFSGILIENFYEFGREEYGLPIIGTLAYQNSLVVVLSIAYYAIFRKHGIPLLLMAVVALGTLSLNMQKTNIIRTLVWACISYNYLFPKKTTIRTLAYIPLSMLVVFVVFNLIMSPYYGFDYRFWVADNVVHLPSSLSFLSLPIVYLSANFPALDAFINDSSHKLTYGAYLFKPVLSFLNYFMDIDDLIMPTHGEFYYIPMKYNVYTFIRHAYLDFGIIGALLFPIGIAIITGFTYYKMRFEKKYYLFILNGIFAWCLFASVFSNHFNYSYMWAYFIISFIIGKWIYNTPKTG